MAIISQHYQQQTVETTADTLETATGEAAAASATTLFEAICLANEKSKRSRKRRKNTDDNITNTSVMSEEIERNQVRIEAEKKYRERRITASNGSYNEATESWELSGLPRFATNEIHCGDKLGHGAFGAVFEVVKIELDEDESCTNNNSDARSFMAEHCLREGSERYSTIHSNDNFTVDNWCWAGFEDNTSTNGNRDTRYAIKKLRTRIVYGTKRTLAQAMIDVATETRILASIPHHPNIIKLRGIASTKGTTRNGDNGNTNATVEAFPSCCFHEDYFLVLDRLYETLEERLDQWVVADQQHQTTRGGLGKLLRGSGSQHKQQQRKDKMMHERLLACHDLASALAHLHTHNIVHRDIKPPNIGFNIRGDLTLFDFGLSREVPMTKNKENSKSKNSSLLFRMTKLCGSPRYMAPEVGLGKLYNTKCDVYSFGLLAWQILTLQKPYDECDFDDLIDVVWPGTAGMIGPEDWNKKASAAAVANAGASGSLHRQSDGAVLQRKRKLKRHGLLKNFKNMSTGRIFRGGNRTFSSSNTRRPKPISSDYEELATIIDRTFRRNIAARPTMKELEECFRRECQFETEPIENNIDTDRSQQMVREHSRRRSTHIFQPKQQQPQQQQQRSSMTSLNRRKSHRTSLIEEIGTSSSNTTRAPAQGSSMFLNRRKSLEDSTHYGEGIMPQYSDVSSSDSDDISVFQ